MEPSVNSKGEYALYDQGNLIGWSAVDYVDGVRVIVDIKSSLLQMKEAAKKEGVILLLAAGLRTYEEQYNLRVQNVIDKTKKGDEKYLKTADSKLFNPATGKPGWSNHQDGKAYDFTTKDAKGNLITGPKAPYTWLVKNAHRFGFVRTVRSERWHWEFLPGVGMFDYVPKNDPTWDGLV